MEFEWNTRGQVIKHLLHMTMPYEFDVYIHISFTDVAGERIDLISN